MPAVSLLVPIYNVEEYLEKCLESARIQTLVDIEVICINDGSTDSSRSIIQRFLDKDSRFVVVDKPNTGYGASMNLGLSKAKGDYIAILESDDVLAFDALQHLYDLAEASDADVAKADFWLYWSQPEERLEPFGIIDVKMAGHVVDPEKEVDIFYRKPSIWSAMYRRSFLLNNDIRFLETPGASYQDASFNFKVWACAKRVIFSTKPILKYRQDNESSSVNSPGKVYCVCDEYDEMEKFLRLHKEKRERFEGVKERMKYDSYLWNYDRLDEKLKKEFLDRAVAEFRRDMDAGDIDWELFEPWAEADLLTMIKSPDVFRESRSKRIQSGKINTLKHYFRIGGLPLVMKIASSKYMRR